MSAYLQHSRSAYYSVVASIPLLLAYELLLLVSGGVAAGQVRNAADVWLRAVLTTLGIDTQQATLAMLLLLILAVPFSRRPELRLRPRYFGLMLLEALVYSVLLAIVIQVILGLVFAALQGALTAAPAAATTWQPGFLQGLALSAGAGLFEEFVFRVILLNLLLLLTRMVLAPWLAAVVSITGAALLFSLAHYVGPMGEPFFLGSFVFRWVAGLLFTLLFYLRGFAITAYAHALYDIRVLLL